ncbi:MAG: metallophosphoesterase family protein [Polyangiaceae bacterium]
MRTTTTFALFFACTAVGTGCSENGGGAATKTPDSFPYTPAGCSYSVAAPEGTESLTMSRSALGALPSPKHIHVSWSGAPESTFAVSWATDLETLATQVVYGTDKAAVEAADGPGAGVARQLGHTMQLGSALFANQKMRTHEAHVCGLSANTTYYYKVGGPGAWSAVYDVATAPAPGSAEKFKFALVGDSRSGADIFAQIQEKLSGEGVDFEVFSGDFVDNPQNQTHWEALFDGKSGSFTTQQMLASRPLMPVNGNHDNLTAYYVGQFALPQEQSTGELAQGEEWYSFDYGNAHFLMLDSEATDLSAQVDFMRADMKKVDRQKTPWVFAVFHTTPYTCGSTHKSDSDEPRAKWQPVFDELEVDMVLTGHVHNYQRTVPIRGFKPGTTDGAPAQATANGVPVKGSGTLYVVSGGASGDLYGVDPPASCYFSQVTEKVHHYVVIEIEGKTLRYKALRLDGTELDKFEYGK